jgi:hypothetical protein
MAPGKRGKSDARYFWLTGRRSTLLAAVLPLPLILVIVLRRPPGGVVRVKNALGAN